MTDQTFPLIVGNKMIANPFPVGIKLTELVLDLAEDAKVLGTVNIQLLNENGFKDKLYKYYKGGSKGFKTEGWYDDDDNTLITSDNDVTFPAGQALWFASPSADYTVTIKAPKFN